MDMARMAREAAEKAGLTMDNIASVGIGIPGYLQRRHRRGGIRLQRTV